MARPRDSRSPSDAGSNARRSRRDDNRRDRNRRNDRRGDHHRRSRSPVDNRYQDRRGRDREHDSYRRRDRSLDRRDRDDDRRGGRRGDRDRWRSPDRLADRQRSADRRPNESRDSERNHRPRRPDSRDGGRADNRAKKDDGRPRQTDAKDGETNGADAKTKMDPPGQPEADKKAERLARLEAWKKKMEGNKGAKDKEVNPSQTKQLLAEMDEKASKSPVVASPSVDSAAASPAQNTQENADASPALSYAGKFDPKAIAKKAAATRSQASDAVWGAIDSQKDAKAAPAKLVPAASALPTNRANLSKFGFQKQTDKAPSKRKLDLDEEDTAKRTLTKLPALPIEADDTPYADQDEGGESDADNFAGNEEEAAAAARAAHERREERMQLDTQPEEAPQSNGVDGPVSNVAFDSAADAGDKMDIEDEDVDPLDSFMAGLQDTEHRKVVSKSTKKKVEPEAYFSGDDDAYREEDGNPKSLLSLPTKRKKKELPLVDYSKLDLEPVRKNFWVEPAELASLNEAETAELRLELDGIKVSGKDAPKPVQKWAQCGLTRSMLDVIDALNFERPTSIQMQAIPILMSGRDVIGVAKTGSGKTLAFLLPMFRHIKDQEPLRETDGPVGLIMTPTRELAVQIHRDCKPFAKALNLRAVCAYGGAPIKDQIAELKRGADIIVCTPGRVIDLLTANQGRVTNLRRATYVVMDEADRMFDMGFEPQIMKIFAVMRPDRQTILFSATMPRIIDSLTKKVLNKPVEITVGGRSVVAAEITQIVEVREEPDKFLRVLELLGELYEADEDARTLIFVERQEKADDLLKDLMTKGYPCMSIHGGKDQIDRDSTISDFKNGIVPILIATSLAARGLDVKQLKLVINFDAPNHLEDYVHRAGRTGRAGNKGTAVTFITKSQDNCAAAIAKALEQSGQPVPETVDELRKAHKEKVKAGRAKESSGFGGKGLDRYDQEREAARLRERKTHKAEGDDDEKDAKPAADGDKNQKAATTVQTAASAITARDAPRPAEPAPVVSKSVGSIPIVATGNIKTPLDKVSSAVSAINSRLGKAGQLRTSQNADNKGPDAGAFQARLEINDFPQKARWAVTNRTNVAKILEATGTSITTKGMFYPAGKEAPPGAEPKLYILVEGDTEVVVAEALAEMTRLLEEGIAAAADAEARAPTSGRYTVS